jgi:hypothetical protein
VWVRTVAQKLDEKGSAMSRELSDLADRATTRFLLERAAPTLCVEASRHPKAKLI